MVIEKAKLLLGLTDSSQDSLLELYQGIALDELSSFASLPEYPENLVAQMVVIKFQKKGLEAVSSAQYSDSRETFFLDYPPYILNQMKALQRQSGKLKTL